MVELEPTAMARNIMARMRAMGLNPYSTAKKAGLGDDYVRDILRGRVRDPSATRLRKLAAALGCSPEHLQGIEGGLGTPAPKIVRDAANIVTDRISARLNALGLSARSASQMAGLGPDGIRTIFNGHEPSASKIVALACALNCSADYLLGIGATTIVMPPLAEGWRWVAMPESDEIPGLVPPAPTTAYRSGPPGHSLHRADCDWHLDQYDTECTCKTPA